MNTAKKILRALSEVDERYIAESGNDVWEKALRSSKKSRNITYFARIAVATAACFVLIIIGRNAFNRNQTPQLMIGSPIQYADSLEEACELAGFEMSVPDAAKPYTKVDCTVYDGAMIEVSYMTEDESATGYYIRKAAGSDDISGDYNEYAAEQTLTVNGVDVVLKGNDGAWNLAIWTKDGYTYALVACEQSMSLEEISALVSQIL